MDITPVNHLPASLSFILAVMACLAPWPLVVITLRRILANRRLAAQAEARGVAKDLRRGPTVLVGRVKFLGQIAVRGEISLEPKRCKQCSERMGWREVSRQTTVEPFLLELESGGEVRVEPNERVLYIDTLGETLESITGETATRIAELSRGERVFVSGQLVDGEIDQSTVNSYREMPQQTLRLVPMGKGKESMIISIEELATRYRRRLQFHLRWFFYAVVALAVTLFTLVPYTKRLFLGENVSATVIRKHSSGDDHFVYADSRVDVAVLNAEIGCDDYTAIKNGDVVFFRLIKGTREGQIGKRATVNFYHLGFIAVGLTCLYSLFHTRRKQSRPWFERTLDDERCKGH